MGSAQTGTGLVTLGLTFIKPERAPLCEKNALMEIHAGVRLLLLPLVAAGCTSASTGLPYKADVIDTGPVVVNAPPDDSPHVLLSEWGLFTDMKGLVPNERVHEFAPVSPLYADYTTQRRFVWMPEGTTARYDDVKSWEFPEGTILAKTFAYPVDGGDARDASTGERKLETRILLNWGERGWKPYIYLWREDQKDADREIAGDTLTGEWIDAKGESQTFDYAVPNANECAGCHGLKTDNDSAPLVGGQLNGPLGMRTAQLNTDFEFSDGSRNQIENFASMNWFDSAPDAETLRALPGQLVDAFGDEPLVERVRSYFDGNCAHCHSEDGLAASSGLWLEFAKTEPTEGNPTHWGVCKIPASAGGGACGLRYDVVPGDAEASVLLCRVASAVPRERMPAMGSRVPHVEWVELVRSWINAMPADDCSGTDAGTD